MSAHALASGSRRKRAIGGAVALSFLALIGTHGCGDDGTTEPEIQVPGNLTIALVSPNGPEGAAVLETGDSGILEIVSSSGRAFLGGSGSTTRIVILMATPGQIEGSLRVADVNRPPQLRLVEVADGNNELRPDLSGYAISIPEIDTLTFSSPREVGP